ncbi:MAG: non-canonical purine NTP pyrophosphatase [Planctomycetota bacterium]
MSGKILLATGNRHKREEFRRLLGADDAFLIDIESLGATPPTPVEDGDSYLENATIKARSYFTWSGLPSLADDSGLEVAALDGAPGIHSARYAGIGASDAQNLARLLDETKGLDGRAARRARFVCVLVLWRPNAAPASFRGELTGYLRSTPVGGGGFGYDPIFVPDTETRTLAELEPAAKDLISHRGRAAAAFRTWLQGSEFKQVR